MPFIEQDEKGNYRLGSGFFDKDAWMMNAIPTVSQLLAGGEVSKLGAVATRNAVENSIFNRLSKKLPEEAARQVAKETAERAASVAGKTAFVGTMAATAQGSGGTDMREQINSLSFMQGLSKLGRAIKEDPKSVLKRGGMITAASLALLVLNWDDKRYEELPDWDKDTYWHAWLPGGIHILLPKPFEIGLMFGTLPERFVRTTGGQDSVGKFGKLVAHTSWRQWPSTQSRR
ncbi:TPA: LPD38 domain-containing protein [Serratia liquefaciens]